MSRSKSEIIRRLRLGDLQKIMRARHGHTLPDDDAGREYFHELLLPISLGPEHGRRMLNAVEVWAPWIDKTEATQLIDQINRTPGYLRKPTARQLGDKLRVTNGERERLKLKTVKPFDMTDMQLKELRRAKDRARKQRTRRQAGSKAQAASLARLRPWATESISRRTWFRKQAKHRGTNSSAKLECHRGTNSSAINLTNSRGQNSATEKTERPKEEEASHRGQGKRDKKGREGSMRLGSLLARPRASRTKQCH